MEMRGQLHTGANLLPQRMSPRCPLHKTLGWALQLFWMLSRKEKSVPLLRIETQSPSHGLVTVLTELSRLFQFQQSNNNNEDVKTLQHI
jgi:hypothetical protein